MKKEYNFKSVFDLWVTLGWSKSGSQAIVLKFYNKINYVLIYKVFLICVRGNRKFFNSATQNLTRKSSKLKGGHLRLTYLMLKDFKQFLRFPVSLYNASPFNHI